MRYAIANTTPVATTDSAALASQTLRTVALSEHKSVSKSCHAAGFTLCYPCVGNLPTGKPLAYSAGLTATHWLPYEIG
ncbi:hypothetical protein [Nostoc sp.]|uniref:hypothetical protein n=1 Tax=Nostoc sp. TaxID=1180 RepID=UPI002FF75FD2